MKIRVPNKLMLACILAAGVLAWQQGWWSASPSGVTPDHRDPPVLTAAVAASPGTVSARNPAVPMDQVNPSVTVPTRSSPGPSAKAPRADPFSYPPPMVQVVEPRVEPPQPESDPLVLQAISLDGDTALAVINRHIVAVNEQVDAWRVDRIESHVVWLEGPGGRRALRFPATETVPPVPEVVAALVPLTTPNSLPNPGDAP